MSEDHPAIALLEFNSIAVGTRASDALAKRAPVEIVRAGSLQPGKYAVLFGGSVAAVEESFAEGRRVGEQALMDRVLLPDVHPRVFAAVLGAQGEWDRDTIGIIETQTLAATLQASDAAIKGAVVEMVEIRLGDGLGGKGLAYFAGMQADVEAAIAIGSRVLSDRSQPPSTTVIPRFSDELRGKLARETRFAEGR